MAPKLRVLMVEDSPDDADLSGRALERAGYQVESTRVQDAAALAAALEAGGWDVVLTDHALPQLDSFSVIEASRARRPDCPVVVVSGRIGEENAVRAMQLGAADYVSKDHLALLPEAVSRAIERQRSRLELERVRRESEERFRALVQNSSDVITLLEADGTIRYESDSVRAVLGYEPEELVGRSAFELMHPEDAPRVLDVFAQAVMHPGRTLEAELRFRHKDGSWRLLEAKGANLLGHPSVRAVVANARDVTERRATEAALAESEARYRRLVEESPEGVVVHVDGVIQYANAAAVRIFGAGSESDLVGRAAMELLHPESSPVVQERLRRLREGVPIAPTAEVKVRRFDGGECAVETTGIATTWRGQHAVQTVVRDVTDRRRAAELRSHLAAIVENSSDGILATDLSGVVTSWNPAATSLFGYSADEAVGRGLGDLIWPPGEIGRQEAALARVLAGESFRDVEVEHVRKDGSRVWVSASVAPLKDGGGGIVGVAAVYRDATERRRAEEALRKSEKLTALGTLVMGVAHEVNNPLAFMRMSTDLIRMAAVDAIEAAPHPAARKAFEDILEDERRISNGIDRLARIGAGLHQVIASDDNARTYVDVNGLVANALSLAASRVPPHVVARQDLRASRPVWGSEGALARVVLALVTNAAEAMAATGAGELRVRTWDEGGRAIIEVQDEGAGIPTADRARVFAPFFTTKHKASGLSLSMSHRIVENHGGRISFASEDGKGTTFRVELPLAD